MQHCWHDDTIPCDVSTLHWGRISFCPPASWPAASRTPRNWGAPHPCLGVGYPSFAQKPKCHTPTSLHYFQVTQAHHFLFPCSSLFGEGIPHWGPAGCQQRGGAQKWGNSAPMGGGLASLPSQEMTHSETCFHFPIKVILKDTGTSHGTGRPQNPHLPVSSLILHNPSFPTPCFLRPLVFNMCYLYLIDGRASQSLHIGQSVLSFPANSMFSYM